MPSSWVGTADAYDVSFAQLCAGTVEAFIAALGPAGGGRLMLDAGCGPGTVAFAARRAGFGAVGVDADPSMLDLAHRKDPATVLICGSLPNLPFAQGQFDAVVANFVVNHTPDPRASVRDLARVTRPGGRLALTIWTAVVGPMNQLWNDVMAAASVERPPAKTLPPDKDFDRTVAGLAGLLAEARLTDVAVFEVNWLFSHHRGQLVAGRRWRYPDNRPDLSSTATGCSGPHARCIPPADLQATPLRRNATTFFGAPRHRY